MRFNKQWGLAVGGALLLAATAVSAYDVDPKTKQVVITSIDDFVLCIKDLSSAPECLDGLVRYAEKKPKDAFAAGKRARLEYRSWAALPLFEIALRRKADPAQCADEDFHIALNSALGLSPRQQELVNMATQLGFNKCWPATKDVMLKELEESPGGYFAATTCPLFLVKSVSPDGCKPKEEPPPEPTGPSADILALKDIQWTALKLDQKSAVALRGAEDEQVLLVKAIGQEDTYVVKFKNVRGEFNNKVFVTRERVEGDSRSYVTLIDNNEWILVKRRDSWAAGMYEGYLKGYRDGLKVYRGALVDQAGPGSTAEILREFKK